MQHLVRISQHIERLQRQAQASFSRQVLIIEVEQDSSDAIITALNQHYPEQCLLSSRFNQARNQVPINKFQTLLGQEVKQILYDGFCGFHPDGFAALSACLIGGGVFIWCLPPLDKISQFNDPDDLRHCVYPYRPEDLSKRFQTRMATLIKDYAWLRIDHQGDLITENSALNSAKNRTEDKLIAPSVPDSCFEDASIESQDQQTIVTRLVEMYPSGDDMSIVISGDRGRGKSTGLAMIAEQLLIRFPNTRIYISAHKKNAAHIELERLKDRIHFIAPDDLLSQSPELDLLLLDEAAALPVHSLNQIVQHYPRVIMSTTTHAYEGSATGFMLKFIPHLFRLKPESLHFRLSKAYRWAENDRFEMFVNQLCGLSFSSTQQHLPESINLDELEFVSLNRDQLLASEQLLSQVYALLRLAHYRTSADDLKVLLDGPSIEIKMLVFKQHILALAMLSNEGDLDARLIEPVVQGRRRVHGHLVPQSLSQHLGIADAIRLNYKRVMRIVVEPKLQNQGLGSLLLSKIEDQCHEQSTRSTVDILCASFSAEADVIAFWYRNGFENLRFGLNRETASGQVSIMLAKGFTQAGHNLITQAQQRLHLQVGHMPDYLRPLYGVDLARQCFARLNHTDKIKPWFIDDVYCFAKHHRSLISVLHSLRYFIERYDLSQYIETEEQILIDRHIVEYLPIQTHKKQVITRLREIMACALERVQTQSDNL